MAARGACSLLIHPAIIRAEQHIGEKRHPKTRGDDDHPREWTPPAVIRRGPPEPQKERSGDKRDGCREERLQQVDRALAPTQALRTPKPRHAHEDQPDAPEHEPTAKFGHRAFHPNTLYRDAYLVKRRTRVRE